MPNVYDLKHEVKYSNGAFEIPMPEEERDCRDETITRVGFTNYCTTLHHYQEKMNIVANLLSGI